MDQATRIILSNLPLTFFLLGLIAAGIAIARAERPVSPEVKVDKVLAWFVFFSIGVAFLMEFALQVFFADLVAARVGWAPSPFQHQLGLAFLGLSVMGFVAAFGTFGMRSMAILGLSVLLWGAALGRAWEMLGARDFAPWNAGLGFWINFSLPVFAAALLYLDHRGRRKPDLSWF